MKLPSGQIIHEHRQAGETLEAIGKRYGVTRQAVHKLYRNWAENQGIDWRRRNNVTKEN